MNLSTQKLQNIKDYLTIKQKLYEMVIGYIEDEQLLDQDAVYANHKLMKCIDESQNFRMFINLISKISANHQRSNNLIKKIEQLIQYFETDIKRNFSNIELFNIFKKDKRIILFLLQNKMLTIDEPIYQNITEPNNKEFQSYLNYFFPEIQTFLPKSKRERYGKEFFTSENFEVCRLNGENNSYICQLIQNDLIDEFITYTNKTNFPLSSMIPCSIFETNPFLIKHKDTTLIEYAAFFGSIRVFNFLRMNNVDLTPSLWLYAIHGRNSELINLLVENKIPPPNDSYYKCSKESIKCHHNEIADYIHNNFIDFIPFLKNYKNNILSYSLHYHNYSYLSIDLFDKFTFHFLCKYNYVFLVKHFLKNKRIDINFQIKNANYVTPLKLAAQKNNMEIVYLLLSRPNCSIGSSSFQKCNQLYKLKVPSSVVSIKRYAFHECKKLHSIIIPSTMKSIEPHAFSKCSSLKHIELPLSLTTIESFAFSGCTSLTQITIPSNVKTICSYAFSGCSTLIEIAIPQTVNKIESHAFCNCLLIQEITIPQSVKAIESFTFDGCRSLKQITIPISVTKIGISAFRNCSSLKEITIPSSVTIIGGSSFTGCSSLEIVNIPNSVTEIGTNTFRDCSSLKQIVIPSSIKIIEDFTFSGCTALMQIELPSSLTGIRSNSFTNCISLNEIMIPPSVTFIDNFAFCDCSSLTNITLPSYIQKIGKGVFNGCTSLKKISVPSFVKINRSGIGPNVVIERF